MNFYPRPPRGGRRACKSCLSWPETFLSTSPAWGTTFSGDLLQRRGVFLSTSPAWGTTLAGQAREIRPVQISIHVPRVGDDRPAPDTPLLERNFYPRPPRGGRQAEPVIVADTAAISIHVPRVGDDCSEYGTAAGCHSISIHVPRVGDDHPYAPQ